MAKQQKQQPVSKPQVKKPAETQASGFGGFMLRNLAVLAGVLVLYFIFNSLFSKERELSQLTEQFYAIRATNPQDPQLRNLYDRIMPLQAEVQGDTGFIKSITRGYNWAINDLAIGNMKNLESVKEEIHRNGEDSTPQSLLQAKLKRKIGLYTFIEYIKANTPENAVILLPEGDAAVSNNGKWNFIYDPEWMEYFLYPRLCLAIGRENEHPDLAKRITHIVIIEGKGYDKLKYNVPLNQRPTEAVLPYNAPPPGMQTDSLTGQPQIQ